MQVTDTKGGIINATSSVNIIVATDVKPGIDHHIVVYPHFDLAWADRKPAVISELDLLSDTEPFRVKIINRLRMQISSVLLLIMTTPSLIYRWIGSVLKELAE